MAASRHSLRACGARIARAVDNAQLELEDAVRPALGKSQKASTRRRLHELHADTMTSRDRALKTDRRESSRSGERPVLSSTASQCEHPATLTPPSAVQNVPVRRRSSPPWTLAEEFVHGGFSYRVLRRPLTSEGGGPLLTTREEEALFHAYRGYSNKRIAQCLSVSPSTVGVLLFRAAAKFGVKSRHELLLAYERMKSGRGR